MEVNENYAIFFDSPENESLSLQDRQEKLMEWIERYSPAQRGKVLDIGCWNGDFLKTLPASWEKWGIDLSCHPELSVEVNFLKTNIEEAFPLELQGFDLVFAGEIIEHLRATRAFLNHCYQVLKPGGIFILTTPNLSCWLNLWTWIALGQPWCVNSDAGQDGHVRYLAPITLKNFLAQAGFDLLEISSVGGLNFLKRFPVFHRTIFKIFPMRGKSLMAVSKKF
jgi:2-polyprenyl-3-methyl-5-hydroxy-6-metoxy-1,4-benzoquinol methylase